METSFKLRELPGYIKAFVFAFIFALSFGYFSGFQFLMGTTSLTATGVEENYLGNEENEEALEMKFKKSEKELLSTIHSHAISFSLIFFALGALIIGTSLPIRLKKFLLIEPFLSVIVTFGGIWLLWSGLTFMKYIVMISGILISLSFALSVIFIIIEVLKKPLNKV